MVKPKFKKQIKENLKLLGWGVLLALAVFMVTNGDYFLENIKFYFTRPTSVPITERITLPKTTPNTILIPSLGITAPVQFVTQANEATFQAALINGVVHYPGTANAGQVGNDYIFGHSSDYIWSKGHYKTIFALLPHIQIGDNVMLSDDQGNQYLYKVVSTEVVTPDDLSVLSQETNGKKVLTVQTSYPVGTALKRFVVICDLAF